MQPLGSRNRIALLGLSVGLVLADSSVVTLALPKILVQFDVEVVDARLGADLVQPGARACGGARGGSCASQAGRRVRSRRRSSSRPASFACAFSPTFGVLVRVARGPGRGRSRGRRRRARPALRGDRGRTLPRRGSGRSRGSSAPRSGPRSAGSSRSSSAGSRSSCCRRPSRCSACSRCAACRRGACPSRRSGRRSRPNAALLLVSGALVAALFLLVILLINGWRLEPLAAGLVVTIMPLAAIAATRVAGGIRPAWTPGRFRRDPDLGRPRGARVAAARRRRVDDPARRSRSAPGWDWRSPRSRSARWPAALGRRSTAAGRSPRATPGSCSGCSC